MRASSLGLAIFKGSHVRKWGPYTIFMGPLSPTIYLRGTNWDHTIGCVATIGVDASTLKQTQFVSHI